MDQNQQFVNCYYTVYREKIKTSVEKHNNCFPTEHERSINGLSIKTESYAVTLTVHGAQPTVTSTLSPKHPMREFLLEECFHRLGESATTQRAEAVCEI